MLLGMMTATTNTALGLIGIVVVIAATFSVTTSMWLCGVSLGVSGRSRGVTRGQWRVTRGQRRVARGQAGVSDGISGGSSRVSGCWRITKTMASVHECVHAYACRIYSPIIVHTNGCTHTDARARTHTYAHTPYSSYKYTPI